MRRFFAFLNDHLWPAAGLAAAAVCWVYGVVTAAGEIAALVLSPMQWQLIGGGLVLVSLISILVQWHGAKTATPAIEPAKAPAPAVVHNVTSHSQSGGITAHTVNQAPKPKLKWGALTVAVNGNLTNTITGRFEVIAPYPPAALHLRAISPGIESFSIMPCETCGGVLRGP